MKQCACSLSFLSVGIHAYKPDYTLTRSPFFILCPPNMQSFIAVRNIFSGTTDWKRNCSKITAHRYGIFARSWTWGHREWPMTREISSRAFSCTSCLWASVSTTPTSIAWVVVAPAFKENIFNQLHSPKTCSTRKRKASWKCFSFYENTQ